MSLAFPPPLMLLLGHADPTSAAGVQGDLLTVAGLGVHGLSVLTGLEVRDTAREEDYLEFDPELIVAQTRMLLEDMPVQAIKLSLPTRLENVLALAEVISDYPALPVVLDPADCVARLDHSASDEVLGAAFELLLPLTTVLVVGRRELFALCDEEPESAAQPTDVCIADCLDAGVSHVLYTGSVGRGPQVVDTL